VIVDLVPTEDN